jgi:hypothetical protein
MIQFSSFSGENPAAMQTGTSSQRLQSPLPLLAILSVMTAVQKFVLERGMNTALSSS